MHNVLHLVHIRKWRKSVHFRAPHSPRFRGVFVTVSFALVIFDFGRSKAVWRRTGMKVYWTGTDKNRGQISQFFIIVFHTKQSPIQVNMLLPQRNFARQICKSGNKRTVSNFLQSCYLAVHENSGNSRLCPNRSRQLCDTNATASL